MFFSKKEPTPLDLEIARTILFLGTKDVGSEAYVQTLDCATKLHALKAHEKPSHVSKDTLVTAGTNLLGIILVLKHETVNVITSRAMQLLIKPRI